MVSPPPRTTRSPRDPPQDRPRRVDPGEQAGPARLAKLERNPAHGRTRALVMDGTGRRDQAGAKCGSWGGSGALGRRRRRRSSSSFPPRLASPPHPPTRRPDTPLLSARHLRRSPLCQQSDPRRQLAVPTRRRDAVPAKRDRPSPRHLDLLLARRFHPSRRAAAAAPGAVMTGRGRGGAGAGRVDARAMLRSDADPPLLVAPHRRRVPPRSVSATPRVTRASASRAPPSLPRARSTTETGRLAEPG